MKVKTLCVACIALAMAGCMEYNPVLQVEGGLVQGVKTDAKGVYVYRGIPYAAPPLHGTRWNNCRAFRLRTGHYPAPYT